MGRKKNNRGGPPPNNRQPPTPQSQASQSTPSSQNVAEDRSARIAALGAALDAAIATPIPIDDSSIDEAKSKLAQVQESVDAIKASLIQIKDEQTTNVVERPNSDNGDALGEAPFETNTARRKRNRNRKRNKGAKEATPTSDSSDESKKNGSLEQHKNLETSDEKSILEAYSILERVVKETDQAEITAAKPEELKVAEVEASTKEVTESIKEEGLPLPIQEPEVRTKPVKELEQAETKSTPPVQAEPLHAPIAADCSENATNTLDMEGKADLTTDTSKDQPEKSVKPKTPERTDKNNNKKNKGKADKNKASEIVPDELFVIKEEKNVAAVVEVPQVEPTPPKSPAKQPPSPNDSKKQQKKNAKSQQPPVQPQKQEKGKSKKPPESVSLAAELNQNETLKPTENAPPVTESKADALLKSIQNAALGEESKQDDSSKPTENESSPTDSKPTESLKPAEKNSLKSETKPQSVKLPENSTSVANAEQVDFSPIEKRDQEEMKAVEEKPSVQPAESDLSKVPNLKTEIVLVKPDQDKAQSNAKPSSPKDTKRKKNARNGKNCEAVAQAPTNIDPVEQQVKLESAELFVENPSFVEEVKKEDPPKQDQTIIEKNLDENFTKQVVDVSKVEANVTKKSTQTKVDLPERLNVTPPTTPTTVTPKETRKVTSVQEDDTSRIWKILEEASKSLEPVEIEMDEDDSLAGEKSIQPADVALTTADVPIVKEVASDCRNMEILNSVLLEKNGKEAKESQSKKTGNTTPATLSIDLNKSKTASVPSSTVAPAKAVETQPRKSAETKKKQPQKPQAKNDKNAKSIKPVAPAPPAEKQPSISSDSSLAEVEIPLDMSIISDASTDDAVTCVSSPLDEANQPKESVTDSKNVQGSDFVPSVEQSAAEAKSLVATVATPTEQHKIAVESESPAIANAQQKETSAKPKQPESKSKSPNVDAKSKVDNSKSKNGSAPKITAANGSQKVSAEKKPSFPPKPDHLVSSKNKSKSKSPTAATQIIPTTAQTNLKQLLSDDDDEEVDYIEYKFMPRQVFICSICQACKASLQSNERVFCQLCQMVTYCSADHMQIDTAAHKELCTAIQEIAKKRGGHIYNNARVVNNNDYRSLRVHTLNICENLLKRPLQTFEREILLFPRLCGTASCREWRQNQLTDCPSCHQVAYCTAQPEHLIENHQRWCKSFQLYEKLVVKQSVSGRIEPTLPTRIINKPYALPNNIDDIFKDLYENYTGKHYIIYSPAFSDIWRKFSIDSQLSKTIVCTRQSLN